MSGNWYLFLLFSFFFSNRVFFYWQLEKEQKRQKNMTKARQFDAELQKELDLRRKELEEEQREEQR